MIITRSDKADLHPLDERNLPWRCFYCRRKTTFSPDRLAPQEAAMEPQYGIVLFNDGVICLQCQQELEAADGS